MTPDLFVNGNCAQNCEPLKNNTDLGKFKPKAMQLQFDRRTWQSIGD